MFYRKESDKYKQGYFKIIALICARGGSKGIPNKNIKKFYGKPLISWVINAAKRTELFEKVIVSTDNVQIRDVALSCGAFIPGLRPFYLAQDDSNQFDTHAYICDKLGLEDDNTRLVILMNNPFLSSDLIKKLVSKAEGDNYTSLVTTAIESEHPYYFQFRKEGSYFVPLFKKQYLSILLNRQDRKPLYYPFFLACVGKPSVLSSWKEYKREMIKGFLPVMISKKKAVDINTEEDWEIAEALFSINNVKSQNEN